MQIHSETFETTYFNEIASEKDIVDICVYDKKYQIGDKILIHETDMEQICTGKHIEVLVLCVFDDIRLPQKDCVLLGIVQLKKSKTSAL